MIGIVAGSFDPITHGHSWLIRKAAKMIGEHGKLFVVVGVNPDKKYYFDIDDRIRQIDHVLGERIPYKLFKMITIQSISKDLLINHAQNIGASYIFRGIRNSKDFEYEMDIQRVNRKICPSVETVYFAPPSKFVEVSSSTIKGLVGFNDWEDAIRGYVDPFVIGEFRRKLGGK